MILDAITHDPPAYRVQASCEWCKQRRPCDARNTYVDRVGTITFYICGEPCLHAYHDHMAKQFAPPRPTHPGLAASIVRLDAQNQKLKELAKQWQTFARLLVVPRHRTAYMKLQERTEALLKPPSDSKGE